ncbi:MAG: putative LPS assembly protein LptD, partial [Gemmatimonadota bacterium]
EAIRNEQDMSGRFTLSGPLNLFGVLKASPSASYSMSLQNDQLAEDEKLGGRGQFSTAVSFSTKFFRVYDSGLGPVRRWRHTVSPSVGFNYSPKANLFGARDTESAREALTDVLTANVSFSQDLDVKVRQGEERAALTGGDSGAEEGEEETEEERTRTINLLNVTNTFSYDFVRAREPDQLGWRNLSTRITTGVGRSFSVSSSFDTQLVKQGASRETFNPFIRRVTTDFSLRGGGSQGSFRQRGFEDRLQGRDVVAGRGTDEETAEAAEALEEAELQGEGFGPWSLNLTHSWSRTRSGSGNRQSLGIGASLLPSPHWSLNYRTTYDVTGGSFQGQTLALVRNLHDWQATLGVNIFPAEPQDRVQISFSVFLRDVPDLELPYRVRRE